MGKLFNRTRPRWLPNLWFLSLPVGAEMAVDRGKEGWERKRVSHQSGGLHKSHGSGALSVGVAMATGGVKDGKGRI